MQESQNPQFSEELLLQRARAGDSSAFDHLFTLYKDGVYACLWHLLGGDLELVEEAAGNVFLNAYRSLGSFRGDASFSTWIYRIAVNQCLGSLRKKPKSPVASLDDENCKELPDTAPPPWVSAERKAEEQEIREIMEGLTPDYKAVLVLRYFQELSYEEMMQVLGWNLAVVKVKLHRARQAFAKQYSARQKTQGAL